MKKIIAQVLVLFLVCGQATAADKDVITRAMKAYEKMEYQNAISILLPNMKSLPPDNAPRGNLTMGIILLKDAELHQAFYEASIQSNKEYLSDLVKNKKGRAQSRYATLFLAETYLSEGHYNSAIKHLNSFVSAKNIKSNIREIAYAELGLAYQLTKKSTQANAAWAKVVSKSPEVRSALAVAKHRAGVKAADETDTLYKAYKQQVSKGEYVSSRFTANMVYLLTKKNKINDALDFVQSEIIDNASYKEVFKEDKQIAFYDISMLQNMSEMLRMAGVHYLTEAAKDAKYGATANYYLAELGLIFGDKKLIKTSLDKLKADGRLPKQLDKFRMVKANASDYMNGNKQQAVDAWKSTLAGNASDTALVIEIILNCIHTNADCDQLIGPAIKISDAGQGRKFAPLNMAIGRYFLAKGKTREALLYMEKARDKSNKNKIGANDPILLVGLAEAYRQDKAYWENLEIYFEMSRQFPVVRQIQEAVQGTYSTQQKSAGDVKIF